MNSKTTKGFILPILIILALVILGIIAYFFSPKSILIPVPTKYPMIQTDYQTYRNSYNGYEIKYPVLWKLTYQPNNPKSEITAHTDSLLLDINDIEQININGIYLLDYNDPTLETYLKSWASTISGAGKIEKLSTKDIETYYKVTTDTGKDNIIIPIPGSNTRIIHIKGSLQKDNIYIDQILSTFKFVDDIQNICYYGGKEYKIGDQFKALDGCNSCTCEGTQVSCTEIGCFNN